MNKDIKIMIELQRFWSAILKAEEDIKRNNKSIDFWKRELDELRMHKNSLEEQGKDLKTRLKEQELNLKQLEEKISKLEERKTMIQTERELTALEHELQKLISEKGDSEEEVLSTLEKIDINDEMFTATDKELNEKEVSVAHDIELIEKKIDELASVKQINRDKFDDIINGLSANVRSRFSKLIKSDNGIAIAEVHGEICSNCNFQIPAQLATEAARPDALLNCTNCGRYIYKV